jgi:hypothetical protein
VIAAIAMIAARFDEGLLPVSCIQSVLHTPLQLISITLSASADISLAIRVRHSASAARRVADAVTRRVAVAEDG